jgi:hypothetical protein
MVVPFADAKQASSFGSGSNNKANCAVCGQTAGVWLMSTAKTRRDWRFDATACESGGCDDNG